ncbi:MAG: hypothetical protein H6662_12525 [Ardenticatenaceae bacterium]|nr:hypothetical protein [Anaerolineales bacterium]MCB8922402.1 hypothetical protein [Ardenticatenaceae bacterium]MCB8991334.1 hypothetical protein [Ardenticatenaceae bacterium]
MPTESQVFVHPDGYVEVTLVGIVGASPLTQILEEATSLLVEQSLRSILVDGRHGRLEPNTATLLVLSKMASILNLRRMVVLTSSDPNDPMAIVSTGRDRLNNLVKLFFGIHIPYVSDEETARSLVQHYDGE